MFEEMTTEIGASSCVGDNGWSALLDDRKPHRPLSKVIQADWLVIGAGFAGMAATRRLFDLNPQDKIVLLEAGRIGHGPAGRSSGFMIDLPHKLSSDNYVENIEADRAQIRRNRLAIEFVKGIIAKDNLDKGILRDTGKINVAATERGQSLLAAYREQLDLLGEAYATIPAGELSRITGSDFYREGLLTPSTSLLHPAAYLTALSNSLVSSGVQIYEDAPVISLTHLGQYTAETPAGTVLAPKVIIAVNGGIKSFRYFERNLMDVFTFASLTRPLTPFEQGKLQGKDFWGLIPADPMGTTVRRLSGRLYGGDRILIRNRFFFSDSSKKIAAAKLAEISLRHRKSFSDRFPMLDGVEFEHFWGGRLCLSRNGSPAFRTLAPGLFSACCQNGMGSVNGTLSGMLSADLASGCREFQPYIDELLKASNPNRIPPSVLTNLIGNLIVRRREARAGFEL